MPVYFPGNGLPAGVKPVGFITTPTKRRIETLNGVVMPPRTARYPTPKWNAARAGVAVGTRNAKVALLSDSTGLGAWGSGVSFAGNLYNGWFRRLGNKIKSVPVTLGSWYGDSGCGIAGGGSAKFKEYDPRISFDTAVWDYNTPYQVGCFGLKTNAATSAGTIGFLPDKAYDTVDIYYKKANGLGSFTVDVGGAVLATINCNQPTTAIVKTTVTVPLGVQTLNISKVGTSVLQFRGTSCYRNNAEVQLISGAWNAQSMWGYLRGGAASEPADGPRQDILAIAPDLTIICLGINDSTLAKPIDEFKTRYQEMIDLCKTTGDVVLCIPNVIDYAGNANQDTYWSAIREIADINAINLFDHQLALESWVAANNRGLFADGRHPLAAGYEVMSEAFYGWGVLGQ
ncbi:GDSL-type esterase/lipase family protein [Zoogloea sp.]|uniref:GDSL-type esterase/lipase family protein n=1 Tax=Zoogloea sp. TaxID=49181 RepID=UPI00261A279B|nr:GDSL-type esterase/lipase family protein [Zoogloea sp.]